MMVRDGFVHRRQQIELAHCQAEPVGGGQGQLSALEPGGNAGQDGTALVGRRGENDLLDLLAEQPGVHFHAGALVGSGDQGEFLGVDDLDLGFEARAAQEDLLSAHQELHVDPVRGQRGHEVGQQARRHGERAVLIHSRSDPAVDADLQIGCGQLETVIVGRDEDI